MASDYGLNFGFRVSDETRRSSNGRLRTPATGPALLCGTAVEIDPANLGYLKVAASGATPRTGTCGLLLQEEIWDRSVYGTDIVDSFSLGITLPNRLSVLTNGPGTKVWFKNTDAQGPRADGRSIGAVEMYAVGGVAVGRGLAWGGDKWISCAATDPLSFMEVSFYNAAAGLVEAFLTH